MPIVGNLVKEIAAAVGSVPTAFGSGQTLYPNDIGDNLKDFDITNKPNYGAGDWRQSRGYAFQVMNVIGSELKEAPGFQEFRLQINPQELQQDDIFSIMITPTLRGTVVEHHGVTHKDIMISGTTGISPNRREAGALSNSGRPALPVLTSGHSGFEEFHELRSYLRVYSEMKRVEVPERDVTGSKKEMRLVFKNYKDSEYLFVEPIKFTMKRSSQRPHLYDYTIQLKAIGVANVSIKAEQGVMALIADVDSAIDTIAVGVNVALKIISGALPVITRVVRDFSHNILNQVRSVNQALQLIRNGKKAILGDPPSSYPILPTAADPNPRTLQIAPSDLPQITREYILGLIDTIEDAENNLSDAYGIDMSVYNSVIGRTPTVPGPSGGTTYQQFQILNAIASMKRAMLLLASQDSLFEKNIFQVNLEAIQASGEVYSFQTPQSVRKVEILGGDTIQTIAGRELENVDRYRDLILLNNLIPPYIDSVASTGVLTVGDKILIPQQIPSDPVNIIKNKTYPITEGMSETEKDLGVDLLLDPENDLTITNLNDLKLVGGIENMAQAIVIRILIEKGSIKRHSTIGTRLQVGEKVRQNSLADLKSEIVTSLGSDPRITAVPFIQLNQQGGAIDILMIVKIRHFEQPVPIPIKLNL